MRPVLVALSFAACGDSLATSPDASIDSVIDPRGQVWIEYRGDVDTDDVSVLCQDADSSLVLATHPDGDGHANCLMESGGFVTLKFPDRQLLTYASVQIGDTLAFEHFANGDPAVTPIKIKVPVDSSATSYRLYSSCGAREIFGAQLQPLDISLDPCDDTADILVSAITPTRERFSFRDEVSLAMPIVVDTPYQPEVEGMIVVGGALPSAVNASQTLVRGAAELLPRRMTAIAQSIGMGFLTMPRPAAATQMTYLDATTSDLHVIEWEPATTNTTVFWPSTPMRTYVERPAMHATAPIILWRESMEGTVGDGLYIELEWDDANLVHHTWFVLTPRTQATVLVLPTLPYPNLVPSALATDITRFDSFTSQSGYAATRASFRLGRVFDRAMWFTDGERGRVVYQALD